MEKIIKTIIVDDEPLARQMIRTYLKSWTNIEVLAECANGFEALKAIREHQPQLMFLDIQMPKVSGLELMEVLDEPIQVVFTTAYDQYAIRAFELNAIDYLLKPIGEKRLGEAMEKVLDKLHQAGRCEVKDFSRIDYGRPEGLERIVVRRNAQLQVIPLDQVSYIEAQDDYVMVYSDKGRFLKSRTMKYYEDHLPPDLFIRIHRSYLVNVEKILRLEPLNKDTQLVVLEGDSKLKVSRSGYKRLKEVLDF